MTDLDLFSWAEQATINRPAGQSGDVALVERLEPPGLKLKTLRPYQVKCNDKVEALFRGEVDGVGPLTRQLVVMATGAGKTVTFADLIQRFTKDSEARCLVLVDQTDLVDQAIEKIKDTTGIIADAEQGERTASPRAQVVVAMVQSMKDRLKFYKPGDFALIICDECDKAVSTSWQKVLNYFDQVAKVVGFTATPKRMDRRNILNYFQHLTFRLDLAELIQMGFLTRLKIRNIGVELDVSGVHIDKGDLDAKELDAILRKAFGEICEAIKREAAQRKILVFLPLVATSKTFVDVAQEHGLNARHIDGSMHKDERRKIRKAFEEWRPDGKHGPQAIQILCNPLLLGRGFDVPSVDCVLNLRATKSDSLHRQIIGRGTRIFCPHGCPGPCEHPDRKKDLLILDPLWHFDEHEPLSPADLVAPDPQRRAVMVAAIRGSRDTCRPLDLLDLDSNAKEAVEQALIRELMSKRAQPGEYWDADEWATVMGLPDLQEIDMDTKPPLKKHLGRLRHAGIDTRTVRGRAHAVAIIDCVAQRWADGLASGKQVFWLRKNGIENAAQLKVEEASAILKEIFEANAKAEQARVEKELEEKVAKKRLAGATN